MWATQHGFNNMQGCKHELGNKQEGALQQGYNPLMTKK
jgi:hypothetical protein